MSVYARTIIAQGVTTIGATATQIVTDEITDMTAKSVLIISDSGGATNANTALIHIGNSTIDNTGPGIRSDATWSLSHAYAGFLVPNTLYAVCDTAGQRLMWWVFG